MATNQLYYGHFNNTMTEFIKDLIKVFPDDKDIKLFKNSFDLLKIANEKKPCKMFYDVIQEYKEAIYKKDESFFLQKDYSDIINQEADVTTSLIDKLKAQWTNLGTNKDIVWKYLIILCKLSDKCYS